jgi:hypothetical protein
MVEIAGTLAVGFQFGGHALEAGAVGRAAQLLEMRGAGGAFHEGKKSGVHGG